MTVLTPTKREGRLAFITRAMHEAAIVATYPNEAERRAFAEECWAARRAPVQRRLAGCMPHVASRVFGCPLAITQAKAEIILGAIGPRLGLSEGAVVEAAVGSSRRRAELDITEEGVAVVPIFGTLVKRASAMEADSGMTSYESLRGQIQSALADSRVKGILLQVDSPGGEVSGVLDLAETIRSAGAVKPVWALADEHAYSAGYWLLSAAERVFIPRTGGVGSVGVIAAHVDQSAADEAAGYAYTFVTAGAHKADFSGHAPLSDGARERLQAEVDRVYGLFVESVAAHRGLSVDAVRATEAKTYEGEQAIDAGLADELGTLESVLAEFTEHLNERASRTLPRRAVMETKAEGAGADAKVVPIEEAHRMRDEAAKAAKAEAQVENQTRTLAITELCQLTGTEARLSEFLASGKSADAIRSELHAERVKASDATVVRSHFTQPEASVPVRIDATAIIAKRKAVVTAAQEAAERRRAAAR